MRIKYISSVMLILVALTTTEVFGQATDTDKTPDAQYSEMVAEFRAEQLQLSKAFRETEDKAEQVKIRKRMTTMGLDYSPRFMKVATDYPDSKAAVDSLVWVVRMGNRIGSRDIGPALKLLAENHVKDERLALLCRGLQRMITADVQAFLQVVIDRSPHRDARGIACFSLAYQMQKTAERTPGNQAKAEKLYQQVVDDYADVSYLRGNLGDRAAGALYATKNIGIGKVAPEIVAEDLDGVKFKLSDYRGKVVVLDFWGDW
ncbi:MAG TPA: redoxin domain-containing protein [Planctomycetes bacterium]|nr:redoxin domain-containing protein [Planctomycetota bacterium]